METTKRITAILLAMAVWAAPGIVRLVFYLLDNEHLGIHSLGIVAIPISAIALWVVVRVLRDYPADPSDDQPPESLRAPGAPALTSILRARLKPRSERKA